MTVILGSAAVAFALVGLIYTVAGRRTPRNVLLGAHGTPTEVPDVRELHLSQGAGQRVVGPALSGLAERIRRISPVGRVEALYRQIELAGLTNKYPVELVLLVKFVAGAAVLAAWIFTPLRDAIPYAPIVAILTTLIAFFLPDYLVLRTAEARQLQIQQDLADSLDQITMSVEAGLGFEGAVERVVTAGSGPLNDELRRMLLEMQLGASRSDALRHLADRTTVPDLKSFVFAIVQSEAYGLPIAQVLRVQASELRDKRRQRAEERALKIPVLLIFPLAFGIFPALFIVLLGPAAIRIFRDLSPTLNP
ncbi:MAG: type II secretion system F family protein [Acidimicrobiia bacterium]|nr:type II secretion system F family protein [Acidimicrobiia bacterium]NNC41191.1 type II secretion system F family protein [Acidimicrobiia bacterium]